MSLLKSWLRTTYVATPFGVAKDVSIVVTTDIAKFVSNVVSIVVAKESLNPYQPS